MLLSCIWLERGARQQTFAKRRAFGKDRLLLHEGDSHAVTTLDFTIVEMCVPGNHAQKRRFTGAVAADEADAFACTNRQLRSIQERSVAVGEVSIEKCDQGHAANCSGLDAALQSL